MNAVWLVFAIVLGVLAVGCSVTTAADIARGKMRFPLNPSAWGAMIFHLAVALLALWLWGLSLGH